MTKIKGIRPIQDSLTGDYLVLISPESIPHLLLVTKDTYYSLTHKKSVIGGAFQPYLKSLQRKKHQLLFFQLNADLMEIDYIFKKYQKVNSTSITCLNPIKEVLLPASRANFIFELIPELMQQNRITAVYQSNMSNDPENPIDFELSVYTKQEIYSYIDSLNKKYAHK